MVKKIVKETIRDFIKEKKAFTSVDVSNKIKTSGVWISNTDVSIQIKEIFSKNYKRYTQSLIKIEKNNNEITATLYHSKKMDLNGYKHSFVEAMKPDEFKKTNNIVLDDDKTQDSSSGVDSKNVKFKTKISFNNKGKKRDYSKFNFI